MGLDMYLQKRTYIGNQYKKEEQMVTINVPENQEDVLFKVGSIQTKRVSTIIEDVVYWRKANQVHKWFVDNVQDGVDDCGDYYVSRELLEQLIEECIEDLDYINSIEGKDIDEEKLNLPCQAGFFFGGTDYDEHYLQDLEETVEELTKIVKEEGGEFYYTSSW